MLHTSDELALTLSRQSEHTRTQTHIRQTHIYKPSCCTKSIVLIDKKDVSVSFEWADVVVFTQKNYEQIKSQCQIFDALYHCWTNWNYIKSLLDSVNACQFEVLSHLDSLEGCKPTATRIKAVDFVYKAPVIREMQLKMHQMKELRKNFVHFLVLLE